MANSSQQRSRSKKRTIIIPGGTLNEDETTIIHVPRKLNTAAPLLVTNYTDDNYLKVQNLPIWNDELAADNICFQNDAWDVEGAGCTEKETVLEPLREPGQDCTETSEYLNYDHNLLVTPDVPEDEEAFSKSCPPTCSAFRQKPNDFDTSSQTGRTSQQDTTQESTRTDGPPCCFDTTNPNVTYDFRPVYECDFNDPRQ